MTLVPKRPPTVLESVVVRVARAAYGVRDGEVPARRPLKGVTVPAQFCGALHGERLMRSFRIELAHEGGEAGLLLQAIAA
jgi:hypothetical protein